MVIEMTLQPRMTLCAFAEINGLTMSIKERTRQNIQSELQRYFAEFKRCEILNGSVLEGHYGNGPTPDEAMADYAKRISGKLLVVGAYSDERREIRVPILTHVAVYEWPEFTDER